MAVLPDNVLVNALVMIASLLVLAKAAGFLVDGAVGIATALRVPKLLIGIVLVSFATTAPEFTVSLVSALDGHPDLALGNAIGSVIVNIGVAMAVGIMLAPGTRIGRDKTVRLSAGFLLAVALAAYLVAGDGLVSRAEGVLFLVVLLGYLAMLYILHRGDAKDQVTPTVAANPRGDAGKARRLLFHGIRFVGGVAGVVLASRFLVGSAVQIAVAAAVPQAVIGLTLVAIGTSVPEIATCIAAFRKSHGEVALGDVIGANILNLLWIIGAAAAAHPIAVGKTVLMVAFPSMVLVVLVKVLFVFTGGFFLRWKGALLAGLYAGYTILTLTVTSASETLGRLPSLLVP